MIQGAVENTTQTDTSLLQRLAAAKEGRGADSPDEVFKEIAEQYEKLIRAVVVKK